MEILHALEPEAEPQEEEQQSDESLVYPEYVPVAPYSRVVSFADEAGLPLAVEEPWSSHREPVATEIRRSGRERRPPLLFEPTTKGQHHQYRRGAAMAALPNQRWTVPTTYS